MRERDKERKYGEAREDEMREMRGASVEYRENPDTTLPEGEGEPGGGDVLEITGRLPAADGAGMRYFYLEWRSGGTLYGDPLARAHLYSQARMLEGYALGSSESPDTSEGHLADAHAVVEILDEYMTALYGWEAIQIEGYVPLSDGEPLPEGAIPRG